MSSSCYVRKEKMKNVVSFCAFYSSKQSGAIAFLKEEEEIVKPTARFNAFSGLEMVPMYGAILIVSNANPNFNHTFDLREM